MLRRFRLLLAEEEDGAHHPDEEEHRDEHVDAEPAREVGALARDQHRRDEREDDERESGEAEARACGRWTARRARREPNRWRLRAFEQARVAAAAGRADGQTPPRRRAARSARRRSARRAATRARGRGSRRRCCSVRSSRPGLVRHRGRRLRARRTSSRPSRACPSRTVLVCAFVFCASACLRLVELVAQAQAVFRRQSVPSELALERDDLARSSGSRAPARSPAAAGPRCGRAAP